MLELRHLSKRYGNVVALDDVSLTVESQQILGFVGPNGAGKTTAMRIVMGLVAPDAGDAKWRGLPLTDDVRRRFGYMPEERGLYPRMKVHDHLEYLALLSGLNPDKARRSAGYWIDRLGILERSRDRVDELSLGNQQRVQLAAALIHRPDALILDEPFAGLDPVGVDVMSGVLRDEARRGVPVMFSSHQLDLVERLCDAVAIVSKGRIVEAGRIAALRSHRSVRLVRVAVAGADGTWTDGLSGVALVERNPTDVLLRLGDRVDEQQVLHAALAAGPVTHFEVVRPRLSELFREAVQA